MSKRSMTIAGHRTSVSLEEPFWQALADIAEATGRTIPTIVADIDRARGPATSLSSALRLHVLDWYRGRGRRD